METIERREARKQEKAVGKKTYEKPRIIYQRLLETLAGGCDMQAADGSCCKGTAENSL